MSNPNRPYPQSRIEDHWTISYARRKCWKLPKRINSCWRGCKIASPSTMRDNGKKKITCAKGKSRICVSTLTNWESRQIQRKLFQMAFKTNHFLKTNKTWGTKLEPITMAWDLKIECLKQPSRNVFTRARSTLMVPNTLSRWFSTIKGKYTFIFY